MIGAFNNVKIKGIVTCIPANEEGMDEFIEILGEKRVKKQIRMTGVKTRHISNSGQMTADLGIPAARVLMERLQWNPEDIRVLVLVTQHPSFVTPSTSFFIQKELGISKECLVFDVNLGCSGYVSGLRIVSSLLQQLGEQESPKGLLLAGDIQRDEFQRGPDSADQWADFMLFGDAVSATGIQLVDEKVLYTFEEFSDGYDFDALLQEHGKSRNMDGERIFEYAINEVTEYIKKFFIQAAEEFPKPNYYVFHQAQKFMLKNLVSVLEIDEERMLYSLENHGNTSSASIPLALCLNKQRIKNNDESLRIFLCGFGMGLACSLGYVTIDNSIILEVIESDDVISFVRC